jgi:hypothetical protein
MPCAAKFLGSAARVQATSAGGRGGKSSWNFSLNSDTLLLRFSKAPPFSKSRASYDEEHLRQLFLYVEFTFSHTALKEELEPGYARTSG